MWLDKDEAVLWQRGRNEFELYVKDVAGERGISLAEARVYVEELEVAVPLIGEPRGGLMYGERKVWYA